MLRWPITYFFLVTIFLSACGGSTSAGNSAPTQTPTPDSSDTVPPTTESAPQEETETPTLPTAAPTEAAPTVIAPTSVIPTPTQADLTANSGNPDLDYAQVIFVRATQNQDGLWKFNTTVRHNDQGWDDYADAWQVVDPTSGQVLAERILLHPHDNEQPFTRSQNNIEIPPEVTRVIVRAKDNVEGFGGQEVLVDLTVSEGENFEVSRP